MNLPKNEIINSINIVVFQYWMVSPSDCDIDTDKNEKIIASLPRHFFSKNT